MSDKQTVSNSTLDMANSRSMASTSDSFTVGTTCALQDQANAWLLCLPGQWSLVRPILLEIETDGDGTCIVSDQEFGVYGTGESKKVAIDDYAASLTEYAEIILADRHLDAVKPLVQRLTVFLSHSLL